MLQLELKQRAWTHRNGLAFFYSRSYRSNSGAGPGVVSDGANGGTRSRPASGLSKRSITGIGKTRGDNWNQVRADGDFSQTKLEHALAGESPRLLRTLHSSVHLGAGLGHNRAVGRQIRFERRGESLADGILR